MKIALYAGVLLVSRVVGPRRLGGSVAVKINSKAQSSKEFHRAVGGFHTRRMLIATLISEKLGRSDAHLQR